MFVLPCHLANKLSIFKLNINFANFSTTLLHNESKTSLPKNSLLVLIFILDKDSLCKSESFLS